MKLSIFSVLLVTFFFIHSCVNGQNLPIQSINTAGGTLHSGGYSLDISIGQLAFTTLTGSNFILTQGFQQANKFSTTATHQIEITDLTSWPNPVNNHININTGLNTKNSILNWKIIDMQGRIVRTGSAENEEFQLDVSDLHAGFYILNLFDKSRYGNVKFTKIE